MSRVAFLLVVGCGRIAFGPTTDAGTDGAPPLPAYWGDYAATLDVPQCTGPELLVTDTTSDLDGGTTVASPLAAGPTLSFLEALWISQNRAGADTIRFDARVFPVDAPPTIAMPAMLTQLPSDLIQVCIDGRSRGVIVDWAACGSSALCPTALTTKSLLVGVTYINVAFELLVTDSQLAGSRIGTDGTSTLQSDRLWAVETNGPEPVTIGPGNVMASRLYGIRVFADGPVVIRDNFIGYDPLTRIVLPTPRGIDFSLGAAQGSATILDNVFATEEVAVDGTDNLQYLVNVTGNHFNVMPDDLALRTGGHGLSLGLGQYLITTNRFQYLDIPILMNSTTALISRNRITNNASGAIEYTTPPPVAVPAITSATATEISGDCAAGQIEVFADPAGEANQYLGTTPCTASRFTLSGNFPAGLDATATQSTNASTSELSAPLRIQ